MDTTIPCPEIHLRFPGYRKRHSSLSGWSISTATTKRRQLGSILELQQSRPSTRFAYIRVVLLNFQLTSFLSFRLVTITMVAVFCSQIILQKSFTVSSFGPKVAKSEEWKRKNYARKRRLVIPGFWNSVSKSLQGNIYPINPFIHLLTEYSPCIHHVWTRHFIRSVARRLQIGKSTMIF